MRPLVARTHGDSGQETLRHIGHDDADEEDDGVQDIILHGHRDDEEKDADGDRHSCHDVNEVLDLDANGRLRVLDPRSQRGDLPNDGAVARVDDHARRCAYRWSRHFIPGLLS